MIKPIQPKDVIKEKQRSLPDQVVETFNELIAENWNGSDALIYQEDVVARIKKKFLPKRITNKKIFDNHWLDVEDVFKNAGWSVYYDKPAYNEDYKASFSFSKEDKNNG